MPFISLLVPVYNVEKWLSRCLESLIHQTYRDFEIILIDDGSTDSSGSIASEYEKKYEYIHLYHYENSGISATRNRALQLCKGEYVMFIDSDDFIEECTLEKMVDVIHQQQCDIVTCGYVMDFGIFPLYRKVSGKMTMSSIEALHSLAENKGVNNYPWAKLIAKKCFQGVSFPEQSKEFEDMFTMFKVINQANKVCSIPNRYYHYVQRHGSLTHNMNLETVYKMRESYEYQESSLHRLHPEENFDYNIHYYNIDMLIIYTLIVYYSKKDCPVYYPADIDWKMINPILHIGYKLWVSIARLKFGWSFKQQLENK